MGAVAVAKEQATNPLTGFVPVQLRTLRTTRADAADLFVQYEPNTAPMLYSRVGSRPGLEQFAELEAAGIENLYVRNDDFFNFSSDLMDSLELLLQQESLPTADKFAALQLAIAVEVEQTLRLVDCSKFQKLADRIGHELVDLLGDADVLPRELFQIARHDFNTFTHVTNVASYSVILAQHLGYANDEDLRQIASAAVLHDIGKRFIPAAILTKPGRLDPDEREIIEMHPLRGYEELCQRSELRLGQLMMVYQHHERVDGTGYPVKVLSDEIHPWAKLLAVVDVFDAMTARRPYRRPATPEYVLDYQRQHAGSHFDREVVECWISAMTKA
ncbi:MAG TPA: HD domain-containing phosphohydrolase [Lacipirellulaceae bacterium]|nr:HD domain-containing phosphohydrolase [Lacipirellulaceae bacterium]